jgi:hypothetical protein
MAQALRSCPLRLGDNRVSEIHGHQIAGCVGSKPQQALTTAISLEKSFEGSGPQRGVAENCDKLHPQKSLDLASAIETVTGFRATVRAAAIFSNAFPTSMAGGAGCTQSSGRECSSTAWQLPKISQVR